MKAEDIYHRLKAIAEPIHAYDEQLVAFAKWIETEFTYTGVKLNVLQRLNDAHRHAMSTQFEAWSIDTVKMNSVTKKALDKILKDVSNNLDIPYIEATHWNGLEIVISEMLDNNQFKFN